MAPPRTTIGKNSVANNLQSPASSYGDNGEITTTYRSIYGGPSGLSASSWTSRSAGDASPAATTTSAYLSQASARRDSLDAFSAVESRERDAGGVVDSLATQFQIGATVGSRQSPPNNANTHNTTAPAAAADEQLTSTETLARAQAAIAAARQHMSENRGAGAWVPPSSTFFRATPSGAWSPPNRELQDPESPKYQARPLPPLSAANAAPLLPPPALNQEASFELEEAAMAMGVSNTADGAANRAAHLVSLLTTGGPREQLTAAKALLRGLVEHGQPVRAAAHRAGGTHMLYTLLRSGDERLQDVCGAALAEIAAHPPALLELDSAPDAPWRLIGACLRGIVRGKEYCARLFAALVGVNSDAVKAACAGHKVVRVLSDTLVGGAGASHGQVEVQGLALSSLEALCVADPGPNLRKLAWGGGLAAVVPLAQPVRCPHAAAALRLLLLALQQDSVGAAEAVCAPACIQELALLIADPAVAVEVQAGAARVLAAVASLPARKSEATQALMDGALPRACEVLHRAKDPWAEGAPEGFTSPRFAKRTPAAAIDASSGGKSGLQAACALLVGHLALGSRLCCHVVLFHAQVLHIVVSVLSGCQEYRLVGEFLGAAGAYAANPTEIGLEM